MKDVRTIYDQGAEEYGRPQLDSRTLGGVPQFDDDELWDDDSERHPNRYEDNSALDDKIDGIRRDKDGWAIKPE